MAGFLSIDIPDCGNQPFSECFSPIDRPLETVNEYFWDVDPTATV